MNLQVWMCLRLFKVVQGHDISNKKKPLHGLQNIT